MRKRITCRIAEGIPDETNCRVGLGAVPAVRLRASQTRGNGYGNNIANDNAALDNASANHNKTRRNNAGCYAGIFAGRGLPADCFGRLFADG